MKKQLLFGLAISSVCLYFVFRGLSLRDIAQSLHQADLRWIALALVSYTGAYFFRTIRWELLIRPVRHIPAADLFDIMIIGFFANNILPFRMGELIRAHLTGRKFQISRTASLATIILERLYDTVSFLLTFLVVTLFFPFPLAIRRGAYAMSALCFITAALIILGLKYRNQAEKVLRAMPAPSHWQDRLMEFISNFAQGVSGMTQGSYIAGGLGLSLAVWICEGTTLYLIAHAFPICLAYPQAFFLLFVLGLSVLLPQAPGYVGTVELAGVAALSVLGISREKGLPIILTIHAFQFTYTSLLGMFALWREGLSFRTMRES